MKAKQISGLMAAFSLATVMSAGLISCDDNEGGDDTRHDASGLVFNGNEIGDGSQEFEVTKDYTLDKGTYLLKGWVYVTKGTTLTIEPGTVIKGDKDTKATLIVEPGGKLIAQGTASEPIVFTSAQAAGSRRPGDWGGLIICGNARNNQQSMAIEGGPRTNHGGSNDDDNSGVLSYVRVEFAGYPYRDDQEINGITFGSVGRGTKVDHVQVSYSNDDSYEWFGGAVNAKYLVAYHGWDDDFDTDNGFSGHVQFCYSLRNPRLADQSVSNGFESDNCADAATKEPFTSCVFSNVTFVGPMVQDPAFANNSTYINAGDVNPQNGSKLGQFQAAMQVRRNSHLSCFNSVAVGFPVGLIVENDKGSATQTAATDGTLKLNNLYFAQMGILGSDKNKSFKDGFTDNSGTPSETQQSFSHTYFEKSGNNNHYYDQASALGLGADYKPASGSLLLNAASFSDPMLGSGFDIVSYAGAFSGASDNWMNGWTNFDPQNTAY